MQRHAILAALVPDHEPAACVPVAAQHLGDLVGMHEEAAHLGRLVRAPHPAPDAHVRAAAGARVGQHGRKIAGAESDQRVIAIEGRDDHFAHFAGRHRLAGPWPHYLENQRLLEDHPLGGPAASAE